MKLAVSEIFRSIQGQGYWFGTPAVFVRLQGCAVACPWCNEKQTWDFKDQQTSVDDVVSKVLESKINHVILTGGEPLAQDIQPLLSTLISEGKYVQIEASGTEPLPKPSLKYWITVSPKFDMARPVVVTEGMDEIKIMVGKKEDVDRARDYIKRAPGTVVFLHPISGSAKATAVCVEEAMANNWRVSVQLHNLLGLR